MYICFSTSILFNMSKKHYFRIMIGPFIKAFTDPVRDKTGMNLRSGNLFLVTLFLLSMTLANAQTTETVFDIHYNKKVIGTVTALKIQSGNKIVEDLHTKTDSKVLMLEVHVESEINITYNKNILSKGVAYRRSNRGNEDIQSSIMKTDETSYSVERDHKKQSLKTAGIDFCVIDLYFTEPVGKTTAFSNMYGQFISITKEGAGKYKTVLPDGKKATYLYEAGKLQTIEVDMPIGKVISKRRK
jgi:hypothetical protein